MQYEPNAFEVSQPTPKLPARRIRHDGWTVERQEKFLKALAACGCITDAARSVGMSRQSAHNLYNHPAAVGFRRAFDAALDSAAATAVESGAWERAVKGVARPIFYKGEQVSEYRHYDERLTMFLLRIAGRTATARISTGCPRHPSCGRRASTPSSSRSIPTKRSKRLTSSSTTSSTRPNSRVA
jgi:hypothetical protein